MCEGCDSHCLVIRWMTAIMALLIGGACPADAAEKLRYNRDIRPILSDKCFTCHGPDAAKRQAELRLDDPKSALDHRDGKPAIIVGDAGHSRLYQRLITTNPDEKMPPAETGHQLTAEEIAALRRWINEGAEYEPHWSFIAPQKFAVPDMGAASAVDAFVQERLQREHLQPAPRAEKTTLIRRASFDLIGLPPTLSEIAEFVTDESPDAFERLLDRLFASPRYGERMATPWMQAARYADTNGYQSDGPRTMWRWRDWVIDAYNRNLPFDQFTIEQLAGDLLPNPELDQLIATGFNRNHRGNAEGGIIPEEFLVEYIVDRVETTSTVWLGLTLGCCRCHDHKYDPVSQKEFYGLYSFFNQVPELGKTLRNENSPPVVRAPTRDQQRKLSTLDQQVASAHRVWEDAQSQVDQAQRAWEQSLPEADRVEGTVARLLEFRRLKPDAAAFDGQRVEDAGDVANVAETDRFAFAAWVEPKAPRLQTVFARMVTSESYRGYELRTVDNKLQFVACGRILDDLIRVETKEPIFEQGRRHVVVTYDASKLAPGVTIYVDGEPAPVKILSDLLSNPFRAEKATFTIGGGGYVEPFIGDIDDIRLYRGVLTPEEIAAISVAQPIDQLAALPIDQRSKPQSLKLREYFLTHRAPPELQALRSQWHAALAERNAYTETLPTTMVMQDVPGLRETHVLVRGEYNRPGEKAMTGTPRVLPQFSGANRLDFARWLVSPEHPLTSRVTVNRYWTQFFGTGLVKTTEDFGAQGALPSHPELLDWLSVEFQRLGWDTKRIQRKMLESAAYQQSAKVSPELLTRDPDNRLLARGPRFRLTAEMLRDAALSAAGLLVEEIGGPSVKPYQPPGLWEEVSSDIGGIFSKYEPDPGAGLYRRGLYTFWKRTISPPMMTILDSPTRDMCRVATTRTNTPLQALNLMNDVTYLEAARLLAERMMSEGGSQPSARIAWAFETISARQPTADELAVLVQGFERRLATYREQPDLANDLLSFGRAQANPQLDRAELAGYATTAAVLLNLDEFVTRE